MKRWIVLGMVTLGALSLVVSATQQQGEMVVEVEQLEDNLYVLRGGGGNSAVFVTGDGHVDPARCAQAYAAAARDRGVRIDCNTEAKGLEMQAGKVCAVDTNRGRFEADRVIVTSGPWSGRLLRGFGLGSLPMQTIRHQRARTIAVAGVPEHHPVVRVTDVSCYVRPEQGGYLYGFFEPDPTLIDLDALPADFCTDDVAEPLDE